MTISKTIPQIVDYLDRTYFKNVWNSVRMEARINLVMKKTHDRPQSGLIKFSYNGLELPTNNDMYSIYSIPNYLTDRSFVDTYTDMWLTGKELSINNRLNIFVYSKSGKVVPLKCCWFYISNVNSTIIISCDTTTLRYMGIINEQLYITLYKDVDRTTPINVFDVTIPNKTHPLYSKHITDASTLINKKYNETTTTIFLNGINYLPSETTIDMLDEKTVLEIREDPDIDIKFTTICDENYNGYYSDLYKGYREIIHIPKEHNPNNITYTHNSITFYVRDMDTGKGVYYHRVQPTTVRNITHNDFSLDRDVLNAFKNVLNATRIQVETCIRTPKKVNHLINDRICIMALYQDTDENIVKHLTGSLDRRLDFWKAENAEKSGYIDFMYTGFGKSDLDKFELYKNSFGAFSIGELLTFNHYLFTSYLGGTIKIEKPFLLRGKTCKTFIYVGGIKIPEYKYNVDNTNECCYITFINNEYVNITELIVAIYEDTEYKTQQITPTKENIQITIANDNFVLYEKIKLNQQNFLLGKNYSYCYKQQPTTSREYKNNVLSFNNTDINKNYLITTRIYTMYIYKDITQCILEKRSLIFRLDTWNTDIDDNVIFTPTLGINSFKLFLNGHMLTPHIDFTIQRIKSSDGLDVGIIVYVSNKNYLNINNGKDKNEIEIYASNDTIISEDIGYQDHSYLQKKALPNLWYNGINWCLLEGNAITEYNVKTSYLKTTDLKGNGKVFYLYLDWLSVLVDLFKDYDYTEDKRIQKYISLYYEFQYPETDLISFIPEQHEVYSVYITKILEDMKDGIINPVYDISSDMAFLQQFKNYEYLIEYDSTINENNFLNRLYVAVGGTYDEAYGVNEEQALIIRNLIRLKLYPSKESIGTTYI